jgi:hypothetical protein
MTERSVQGVTCEFVMGRTKALHRPCGEPAAQWVDPKTYGYTHVTSPARAMCEAHVQKEKERLYQAEYYQRNADDRLTEAKTKWKSDPAYRKRETDRKKDSRAVERGKTAEDRFLKMVATKAANPSKHRNPRWAEINGTRVEVYSTGYLGEAVGRDTSTMRMWLNEGVLPGCSVVLDGANWFSKGYIAAVFNACRKLYYFDGRGERGTLKRLIREQLEQAGEKWVTPIKNPERVTAFVGGRRRRRTA